MKCFICNSEKAISKHHINYKDDITIPLCRKCHIRVHNKQIVYFPNLLPIDNLIENIKIKKNKASMIITNLPSFIRIPKEIVRNFYGKKNIIINFIEVEE